MALSAEVRRARRAEFNRMRRARDRKNAHLIQARSGHWLVIECPECYRHFDVRICRPIPDCCPECQ